MTIKFRYKKPGEDLSKLIVKPVLNEQKNIQQASENLRFAAAAAEFGLLLRQSEFMQQASFDNVLTLAGSAIGKDEEGYRAEFVKLVRDARLLTQNKDLGLQK